MAAVRALLFYWVRRQTQKLGVMRSQIDGV